MVCKTYFIQRFNRSFPALLPTIPKRFQSELYVPAGGEPWEQCKTLEDDAYARVRSQNSAFIDIYCAFSGFCKTSHSI